MKTEKRKIGDIGEDTACKYLMDAGYCINDRNYYKPWGEIDIVASKDGILVFVEVKSVDVAKVSHKTVRPEENMTVAKIQKLNRVINSYLEQKRIPRTMQWRIDLACVYLDFERKKGRVEMLENAHPS